MDETGSPSTNALLTNASVASILGIQGSLRFRPHGSTQRPHVILRRVTGPECSDDSGQTTHVVRFSLFAAKRIEVKPGKEILLTVASEDDQLENQCVVFEAAGIGSSDTKEDGLDTTVVKVEESAASGLGGAMPPKMRRAWNKKNGGGNNSTSTLPQPTTKRSIGTQVEREYTSIPTQTESHSILATLQNHTFVVSKRNGILAPHDPANSGDRTNSERGSGTPFSTHGRERSGSPMELDSRSPTPEHSPTMVPDLIEQLSLSPQDTLTPLTSLSEASTQHNSPVVKPPQVQESPFARRVASKCGDAAASVKVEHLHIPSSTSSELDLSQGLGKSDIPVPFVSAGFVTNFFGNEERLDQEQDTINMTEVKTEEIDIPSPSLTPSLYRSVMKSAPEMQQERSSLSPMLHERRARSTIQNAVASSSRLPGIRRDTPPHQVRTIPSEPRSLSGLTGRAREKAPISLPGPGFSSTTKLSSPPDPKSLACISVGPSSNPLMIRPSSGRRIMQIPKTPSTQQSSSQKKRVIVGAGWPLSVKAVNGISEASPESASPPTPQPDTPAVTLSRSSNLSNMIAYTSPSPPSTPVLSISTSKWKRIAGDQIPTSTNANVTNIQRESHVLSATPQNVQDDGEHASTLSLRDRLAPVAPQTSLPQVSSNNGRDLLSRISEISLPSKSIENQSQRHASTTSQPPAPETPNVGRRAPTVPSQAALSIACSVPTTSEPKNTLSSQVDPASIPSTPVSAGPTSGSFMHPLPPKPAQPLGKVSNRGLRRRRVRSASRPISPTRLPSPSSESTPPTPPRKRKRIFRWQTVDSRHIVGLEGEGDLGVRNISFSSDGEFFAVSCVDRTIRVWNNRNRVEIARLSHNSPIISAMWMDGDAGVVSLGEDGLVSKWTRSGQNHWQWAKIVDAGAESSSENDYACLAYSRDRIAVSFPRSGVKVWFWVKGTWQPQRSIVRANVTAIKFVRDGAALIGGTRDGVLWYCEVPNGTLRAYAFLKAKIDSLDLNPTGTHVLVGQVGGHARLVGIGKADKQGGVEQSYSCAETEARDHIGFGAVFATQGQAVLFGSIEGCVLVWDRKKGVVVYGLKHDEDDLIQAVASFDNCANKDGCLVTGTKSGHLAWWPQPVAASCNKSENASKRLKRE